MEWKYKKIPFKAQIGDQRSLVLTRDDPDYRIARQQSADEAGQLTFTNLDNFDLFVTCSYNSKVNKN